MTPEPPSCRLSPRWRRSAVALAIIAAIGVSGCVSERDRSDATPAAAKVADRSAPRTVEYEGRDGSTALELLDERASVRTERSELGEYVVAIDGRAATKRDYWTFFVDGKPATVGADAYDTSNGERIEWRYGH